MAHQATLSGGNFGLPSSGHGDVCGHHNGVHRPGLSLQLQPRSNFCGQPGQRRCFRIPCSVRRNRQLLRSLYRPVRWCRPQQTGRGDALAGYLFYPVRWCRTDFHRLISVRTDLFVGRTRRHFISGSSAAVVFSMWQVRPCHLFSTAEGSPDR